MKVNKEACEGLISLIKTLIEKDAEDIADYIYKYVTQKNQLNTRSYLTAVECADALYAGGVRTVKDYSYVKTASNASNVNFVEKKDVPYWCKKIVDAGFPAEKMFWDIYKEKMLNKYTNHHAVSKKIIFDTIKKIKKNKSSY